MSLATYAKQDARSKAHFSEYIKTENKPEEGDKPAETTPPEPQEAE